LKAPEEVREAAIKLISLGRLGRPDEVAAAALFLSSDDSTFTTGSELYVDRGAATGLSIDKDHITVGGFGFSLLTNCITASMVRKS
jgi:hypothetical protein